MGIFNNLKKWLGMATLAGSLMLPNTAKSDNLLFGNIGDNSDVFGSAVFLQHNSGAQEISDETDVTWAWMDENLPNPNNKWLKVHTQPYTVELETDGRPP
jgi:hypothetical protein